MWVKICGFTNLENALEVASLGIHAIGLNFYGKSPRCTNIQTAKAIFDQLPKNVEPIGLFVNESVASVRDICSQTGLRTIQLHGDETIGDVQTLANNFEVIRAFRVDESGLEEVATTLNSLAEMDVKLKACLIDARMAGQYGGSGHTAPWELLSRDYQFENWPLLVLAGGITPLNAGDAVKAVQPWGIDTASGVEYEPGIKAPNLVNELLESLR